MRSTNECSDNSTPGVTNFGAERSRDPRKPFVTAVACRVRQQTEPFACWLKTPGIPFRHFGELLRGVQHMIHTRESAYAVERTLLTTGILDRMMHSMYPQQGKRLSSPELAISYETPRWGFANREETNESAAPS